MICWVEYPLLPEHISALPADIIDGVLGRDASFIDAENRLGLRQLVYTSLQGAEYLFPNYWELGERSGRLHSAFRTLTYDAWKGNPIGVFGAAWDDSGLHNETFWLGWSTVAQYGWTHGMPSVEQHVAEFFHTYYGADMNDMIGVYRGLQQHAMFFNRSWDQVVSRARAPGYGNSYGKGRGVVRRDDTLPPPGLPRLPGLDFVPSYSGHYEKLVREAGELAVQGRLLIEKIYENLPRANRNRYNLEVLLSIARLTLHHEMMIAAMGRIESNLADARVAAVEGRPSDALEALSAAYQLAEQQIQSREQTFQNLKAVWEKSQYPKGREVAGRKFVHILDDTKDHWADRRADLSYLTAPEESIGLNAWMGALSRVAREYAGNNGVQLSPGTFGGEE
jgi:hypothetical protein